MSTPDYVIIGRGQFLQLREHFKRAVRLVLKGAKLIGTNSHLNGPCRRPASFRRAGQSMSRRLKWRPDRPPTLSEKPNPLMMRTGLRILGVHSEDAVMIGDRMDTDMVAGIETGLCAALVLGRRDRPRGYPEVPVSPAAGSQMASAISPDAPLQSNPNKPQIHNPRKSLWQCAYRRAFVCPGSLFAGSFCGRFRPKSTQSKRFLQAQTFCHRRSITYNDVREINILPGIAWPAHFRGKRRYYDGTALSLFRTRPHRNQRQPYRPSARLRACRSC